MKKQIIPKKSGLNLSKRTISNLAMYEMINMIGGQWTQFRCNPGGHSSHCSNGNSCYNHNTCNSCI